MLIVHWFVQQPYPGLHVVFPYRFRHILALYCWPAFYSMKSLEIGVAALGLGFDEGSEMEY